MAATISMIHNGLSLLLLESAVTDGCRFEAWQPFRFLSCIPSCRSVNVPVLQPWEVLEISTAAAKHQNGWN